MGRRSGFAVVWACTVALLGGVVAGGADAAARSRVPRDDGNGGDGSVATLRAELQESTGGTARFATRDGSGAVTFIGASAQSPLQEGSDDGISTIGRRFIDGYSELFGVAATDLSELTTVAGRRGTGGAVRYQQTVNGVPVIAGQIVVQVDAAGAVRSANGEASSDVSVNTVPMIASDAAAATAVGVTARAAQLPTALLTADEPELWVYDPSLIGADDPLGTRLVWRTDVRTALGEVDHLVLIDAHTGAIALEISQREDALFRQVCDNNNVIGQSATCASPVRSEGDAANADAEVNSAYDLSGETYNFYFNRFGRDSLDGNGMTIASTVQFCPDASHCPYANAFWNGSQMVYGQGFANADDVVGHELTHAVTTYSSGLFYYADSGAINESMSDVMGEFVDLGSTVSGADAAADRWLIGEQLSVGAIRSMKDPTVYGDPDKMTSPLFAGGISDNHGVHTNSGVMNKAAYLITDGATFNGQTIAGLGAAKAAAVFYQVETALLTPGSDYLDLYNLLPQACTNLVGVAPLSITAADCSEVSKAVLATEMNQRATVAGASLTAPMCASGVQNSVLLADDMETASGAWSTTTSGGAAPWGYYGGSSQSGTRSVWALDLAGTRGISTLTTTSATTIPAGSSYLRFDHSFYTDSSTNPAVVMYDGGVVEYSTDGTTWLDISTLPVVNGYNGTIDSSSVGGLQNQLAGRAAFGITSPNYQTTRVDVSSLAGQNAKFRFRLATNNSPVGTYPGWFVDDVLVYTCGAPQVPGAVRNPAATSAGSAAATVTWSAPYSDGGSAITSYVVTPYIGGVAQSPTISSGTGTSKTVTGLTNGTTYTFRVAAVNSIGTGAQSPNSNSVMPTGVPGAPTAVAGTPADSSVIVSWTAPASNGGLTITGYVVTPYIAGVAQTPVASSGTGTSKTVGGLTNGTAYTFRVAAVNSAGTGAQSVDSAAVTPATVPGAPTAVSAAPGNASAVVLWSTPSSDGGSAISSYVVTPYIAGVAQTPVASAGNATSKVVTGLVNGTAYTFRVAAVNAAGTGAQSADSIAVTPATVPDAPTGVTASAGDASALVSWTAPASNGGSAISGYVVTPYIAGVAQTPVASSGTGTSKTVGGLTNGTAYTFRVAAANSAGTGAQSTDSNAVVPASVPGSPTAVMASAGDTSALVSWTAPASNGGSAISGYVVTPYIGAAAQAPISSAGTGTSTTVGGLVNGTAYTFTVAATNDAGTGLPSAASAPVTPMGVPGPPTGVVAIAGAGSALVSWTAPGSNGGSTISGYVVTPYVGGAPQTPTATNGAGTSKTITGLVNGTAYTFRVAAVNSVGTGGQSAESSAVTPATVPGIPTGVSATAGDRSALVSWTAPVSTGGAPITGYTIVPSIAGVAQTPLDAGTGTSFDVLDLTNGTAYTFAVIATNAVGSGLPSVPSAAVTPAAAVSPPSVADYRSLLPARLLETRDGLSTVDGQFNGIGLRLGGSVTALTVAGRGGVAADAAAVVLNVTVTDARAPGYVTLFPCGGETPTASNLNYVTGSTIPNMVVTKVGTNGQVCIFTQSDVHLLADVAGYFPPASSLTSLLPARLLDSRVPGTTVDGQGSAIGVRPAGSVTEVQVAGRASIPGDASAAVLNVTVTEPQGPGYVTVYPCGSEPPTASNLNYVKGQSIPNAVVSKIGVDGKVCVFTQAATHLIVDVNGYFPVVSSLEPLLPARLLESRTPGTTVDGQSQGIGLRPAGSVTVVQVAGRAGVPVDASAVVLNVTVTEAAGAGYATVYPCGGDPPTASNLNYGSGTTIANAAITKLSGDGTICIFTQQATHLLADVTAYFTG